MAAILYTVRHSHDAGAERVYQGDEYLGDLWWDAVDEAYAVQYPGGRIARHITTRLAAAYVLQGRDVDDVAAVS